MALVTDKILGEVLSHSHIKFVTNDPTTGSDGDWIINTNTHILKVYYSTEWRTVTTFSMVDYYLLLETGDFILLETGDKLIL